MEVPLGPFRFLQRAAKYYPDKTALICGEHSLNYSEFLAGANRAANLFAGIAPSGNNPPRIAFITWNCHSAIEASFGGLRAPVVRVPINVRLTPREWAYIINNVNASAVVLDEEFVDSFDSIKSELNSVDHLMVLRERKVGEGSSETLPEGYTDYESALAEQSSDIDENNMPLRSESEPVEIYFTSGTTGQPKGVVLSSRNLYINAINFFLPLQLRPDDIFLHSLNLFHVNGWGGLHFMTACGGTQVVMRRFRPEEFCTLVQEHRVTLTCLVPTMLNMLVHYDKLDEYDLNSLRLIMSGGAKLPTALGREAEAKLDCEILGSYGLTEASPFVTFAEKRFGRDDLNSYSYNGTAERQACRRQSIQRVARGESKSESDYKKQFCAGIETLDTELRVVDEAGGEVDRDSTSVGEILIRGNIITEGYWYSEESTGEAFTSDGWFKTGDLAVVDPEGYVHIVDRKRDIIIRGGENISSLEIEDVLRTHPLVMEVGVIPSHSEKWGEVPLAVIVLRPGTTPSADELLEFCKEHLASFKVPDSIQFTEELPKSGTGKVLKRELRKNFR
ncbi:MAG: AMP-binding protein [Thermoplasmata archaeon]|nr:MAG: AMP-binding protein [Thermoplasmata archaeon]